MTPEKLLTLIQILLAVVGLFTFLAGIKALKNGTIRGSFKNKYRMEIWTKEDNTTAFYFFVICYFLVSLFAIIFIIATLSGLVEFKR